MSNASLNLDRRSEAYLKRLRKQIGKDALYEGILKYFDKAALKAAGRISRNYLSGQRLKRRSGNLARSITGRGELVGGVPALRIGVFRGPALKYAGVQEYGTKGKNPDSPYPTIVPKRAKALAIPTGPALTAAGNARVDSPRQWPEELFFVPMRRGRLVGLLMQRTRDGSIPVFKLMSAVDIAPKFYLRDGVQDAIPDIRAGLVELLKARLK